MGSIFRILLADPEPSGIFVCDCCGRLKTKPLEGVVVWSAKTFCCLASWLTLVVVDGKFVVVVCEYSEKGFKQFSDFRQ